MAVTVDQLAYELRISTGDPIAADDPERVSLQRAVDAAAASVEVYKGAAPEAVQDMATLVLAKYLHDIPLGDRTTWAFPLRNSGALAMLAPWRVHRAAALDGTGAPGAPGAAGDGVSAGEVKAMIDQALAGLGSLARLNVVERRWLSSSLRSTLTDAAAVAEAVPIPADPADDGKIMEAAAGVYALVDKPAGGGGTVPPQLVASVAALVELTRDLHVSDHREWGAATAPAGLALTANVSGVAANTFAVSYSKPGGGWASTIRYVVARIPLGADLAQYRTVWKPQAGTGRDDVNPGNLWEHVLDDDDYSYYATSVYYNERNVNRLPGPPGALVASISLQHDNTVKDTEYDGKLGPDVLTTKLLLAGLGLADQAAANRGQFIKRKADETGFEYTAAPAGGGGGMVIGEAILVASTGAGKKVIDADGADMAPPSDAGKLVVQGVYPNGNGIIFWSDRPGTGAIPARASATDDSKGVIVGVLWSTVKVAFIRASQFEGKLYLSLSAGNVLSGVAILSITVGVLA